MNDKLEDLLYAPIGLLQGRSSSVSELAGRGRMQVANARVLGEMATKMGKDRVLVQVTRAGELVESVLIRAGLAPPRVQDPPPTRPIEPAPTAAPASVPPSEPTAVDAPVSDAPPSESLAIVEYDSLAASQVVPRLAALGPDELEDVRRYEFAHRARKTILGRIAQLQGSL